MEDKEIGKTGEKIFKIFIITVLSILFLAMVYGSITFTRDYFTKSDQQVCQIRNSTLINGICHSECNTPVSQSREIFLFGGIGLLIFALLEGIYGIVLLKTQFNEKSKRKIVTLILRNGKRKKLEVEEKNGMFEVIREIK